MKRLRLLGAALILVLAAAAAVVLLPPPEVARAQGSHTCNWALAFCYNAAGARYLRCLQNGHVESYCAAVEAAERDLCWDWHCVAY